MIKKAIIPIAGLGTRFLPLSKVLTKDLLPLADKPAIQYLVEEARASGIEEVIFVLRPGKKDVLDYFGKSPKLEKILKKRKKDDILAELKKVSDLADKVKISFVYQKEPLGDGHAILQAKKFIKDEPFGVFFGDDVVDAETPCLEQLLKIFKTSQKPTVALKQLPKEKLVHYGIVDVEKISSKLYKIKKIVEKPSLESAPSDLAIIGRYVLTPDIFNYFRTSNGKARGEIILADALMEMAKDGKVVYGYEIDGEWLECGDKLRWMKSNFYYSLKHPQYGPELKNYLKSII